MKLTIGNITLHFEHPFVEEGKVWVTNEEGEGMNIEVKEIDKALTDLFNKLF